METKGYVEIDGVTYKLISRQKSAHKKLRIRSKGQTGVHLLEEESFLKENSDYLKSLLNDSEVAIPVGKNSGGQDE